MKAKAATPSKEDRRPTPDQMYLAERLNDLELAWGVEEPTGKPAKHTVTPSAIQKWNMTYGVAAVSDAMRMAWGFPPASGIENPWAYVDGILRSER